LGTLRKQSALSAWLARLSAEKAAVYEPSMRELETGYDLLSIALDRGLRLRDSGDLWTAREAAGLCGELAERHAHLLRGALGTMERRSQYFAMLPEVHALDVETFRSQAARSSCFWNGLLHKVLFSSRQRWFHKLETLQRILDDLRGTFFQTTRELAEGSSLSPYADWETLERTHDDWNTCLQETTVLLKCLLTTLAPGELEELRRELEEQRSSELPGREAREEKASQRGGRPYV
jgi:hypothetical protein